MRDGDRGEEDNKVEDGSKVKEKWWKENKEQRGQDGNEERGRGVKLAK